MCKFIYAQDVSQICPLGPNGLTRENRVPNEIAENYNTCFNQCMLHRVWLQQMANDKPKLTEPTDSSVSFQRLLSPIFTSSALLFDYITTISLRLAL